MAVAQQVDDFWTWLRPRVAATFGRFPLAIILQLVATVLALAAGNDWFWQGEPSKYYWSFAVTTTAIFALAGSMFGESRPRLHVLGLVLQFLLPALVLAAFALGRHDLSAPAVWLLPVSLLWLSVSPSTQLGWGGSRGMVQDRFWWINHQSVVGAAVCLLGLGAVVLGMLIIETTLRSLFNFSPASLYGNIVTVLGLFVAPVLWLSTIPKTSDFLPSFATVPDNVARAVGALAQFVATPLLFIYAGILLVYLVQILVTWTLPQNTISWMVLTCTFVGALNWLLLHPSFQHGKLLVRLYRAGWFWLMLPPLALYGIAVFVRVDDYGLTPERVLLLAGLVWAVLVTLTHIVGLGDVRLIPALGAIVLALIAVGPLNFDRLTRADQGARLDALLEKAGVNGYTITTPWSLGDAEQVESIIYLLDGNEQHRQTLREVLAKHGIVLDDNDYPAIIMDSIKASKDLSEEAAMVPEAPFLLRSIAHPDIDVSTTPTFVDFVDIYTSEAFEGRDLVILIRDTALLVTASDGASTIPDLTIDMREWLDRQEPDGLRDPFIDFRFGERDYRLVVQQLYVEPKIVDGVSVRHLGHLGGALFVAAVQADSE